ncbi:MAG: ice-binding family protein [Polyangiaceae bacterium]
MASCPWRRAPARDTLPIRSRTNPCAGPPSIGSAAHSWHPCSPRRQRRLQRRRRDGGRVALGDHGGLQRGDDLVGGPHAIRDAALQAALDDGHQPRIDPGDHLGNAGDPAVDDLAEQGVLVALSNGNVPESISKRTTPSAQRSVRYAADHLTPTPANLTVAVGDMEAAFTDAAARTADVNELGGGSIGGITIGPGVYRWVTPLLIPANLTLSGAADEVWIFQIAGDLEVSNGVKISLTGGARPANVFWQVAGKVVVGTTSHFEGVVLTHPLRLPRRSG